MKNQDHPLGGKVGDRPPGAPRGWATGPPSELAGLGWVNVAVKLRQERAKGRGPGSSSRVGLRRQDAPSCRGTSPEATRPGESRPGPGNFWAPSISSSTTPGPFIKRHDRLGRLQRRSVAQHDRRQPEQCLLHGQGRSSPGCGERGWGRIVNLGFDRARDRAGMDFPRRLCRRQVGSGFADQVPGHGGGPRTASRSTWSVPVDIRGKWKEAGLAQARLRAESPLRGPREGREPARTSDG